MKDNEIIEKASDNKNDVEGEKKAKSTRSNALVQILNGEFLSKEFVIKNLNFIFFLIFLLILLVAKGYYDKQLTKQVETTQKEMDEIMGDYVAKKAQLEEETKRITLVEELTPLGLKETVNPTKVIRIKKD